MIDYAYLVRLKKHCLRFEQMVNIQVIVNNIRAKFGDDHDRTHNNVLSNSVIGRLCQPGADID